MAAALAHSDLSYDIATPAFHIRVPVQILATPLPLLRSDNMSDDGTVYASLRMR